MVYFSSIKSNPVDSQGKKVIIVDGFKTWTIFACYVFVSICPYSINETQDT